MKDNKGSFEAEVRMVQRAVGSVRNELGRLGDDNVYALDYVLSQAKSAKMRVGNGVGKELGGKSTMDFDDDEVDDDDKEWIGLD